MNNKRAIYEFLIFELIFSVLNIAILAYFDPKFTFFYKTTFTCKIVDEITLTHTGWA